MTQFTSGADGLFQVVLSPGTYILHPEVMGAFPNAGDQIVVVRDGQFNQVEILVVSQMR